MCALLLLAHACAFGACGAQTFESFFFGGLTDLKEFSTRAVPVQQALLGLLNLVANKPQVFFMLY